LPPLRPAPDTALGEASVNVACHLYDATYAQTPPTAADIAAGYEAAAERAVGAERIAAP
jgi:hypothetical protein